MFERRHLGIDPKPFPPNTPSAEGDEITRICEQRIAMMDQPSHEDILLARVTAIALQAASEADEHAA